MADNETNMNETLDYGAAIAQGAQEVFSTMLTRELVAGDPVKFSSSNVKSQVTSMIGLTGDIRGVLALHFPAHIAKTITAIFLGEEVTEINDDVKDAVGELANMIAGSVKLHSSEAGVDIKLAIPTCVVGQGYMLRGSANTTNIVIPLSMSEGSFWVELLYQVES